MSYTPPTNTVATDTIWDTKGDLSVATAADTAAKLAVGANGQLLVADSSTASGLRYMRTSFLGQHGPGSGGGYLGWAYDPSMVALNTVSTVATQYFVKVPLPVAVSVTNVYTIIVVVANTPVNPLMGLYKSDGTKIGQGAATFTSTGLVTTALSGGPFTVTPLGADDFVWVCLYTGAATTAPAFLRGFAATVTGANGLLTASTARYATQLLVSTGTLPNITPASNSLSALSYWAAIA